MIVFSTLASVVFAAGFAAAQRDPWAPLNKPALRPNLDDVNQGLLDVFPPPPLAYGQWSSGWIPEQCKYLAETYAGVRAEDFDVYEIWYYEDCPDQPWTFCHHRGSTIDVWNMAFQFGRLPLQMREWVRHVIDVPGDGGWAFEYDGSITFVRPGDDMISVIIHETAHSLDLSGAYRDKPMSSSDAFWNAYDRDTRVPDNYARTNMVENVAQNTVIAVYNDNVPGGIAAKEPNWRAIQNQFSEMSNQARDVGQGNSLYKLGKTGQCSRRLPGSDPVYIGSKKRNVKGPREESWPIVTMIGENNFDGTPVTKPVNLTLANGITKLETGRTTETRKFTKCDLHW